MKNHRSHVGRTRLILILLCIVLVIAFQAIGDVTARKIDKRRR